MFLCEFSEIFKNMFFTEHLRDNASVFYWRKKNILFTLSRKEQSSYEAVKFLLETLIYKIWFWNFLAQRKSGVKLVKDIFKHFIIDVGFTSCLTSIRLTYQDLISESFLRLLIGRCPSDRKNTRKLRTLFLWKSLKNATWIGDIEMDCPVRAQKCHSAQLLVPFWFEWFIFISA